MRWCWGKTGRGTIPFTATRAIASVRGTMSDETDPPRKFYRLKPKEFERVNEVPAAPQAAAPTAESPREADLGRSVEPTVPSGAAPGAMPGAGAAQTGRVDVRELARIGSAGAPLLGSNQVRTTANDVHAMLAQNEAVAEAHGLNAVKPVQKFRRRKRDFRLMLVGGNLLILLLYFAPNFVAFQVQALAARQVPDLGKYAAFILSNPPMFVLPLAVMVFYTGLLVWLMFGVMDDY